MLNKLFKIEFERGELEKSQFFDCFFDLLLILLKTNTFQIPPASHELQYFSVTSGFMRMSMKTKYVCRGLICLNANFHINRTMWSTFLHVGKRAASLS